MSGGPYIVTLRKPEDWRCECGDLNRWHEAGCYRCGAGRLDDAPEIAVLARKAVADLEGENGAWKTVADMVPDEHMDARMFRKIVRIGSEGGKVSLPDGSVVEVERTTWPMLAKDAGFVPLSDGGSIPRPEQVLIAWNDKYEVGYP